MNKYCLYGVLLFVLNFFQNANAQLSTIQWQKSFGGSAADNALSIINTTDSGFVIAGYSASTDGDITSNNGTQDYWIIKLDNGGGLQWEESYGGSNFDVARSVVQTTDGGYIVAGYSWSTDGFINSGENHGMDDYWIVKLDISGGLMWQTMLGGSGNDEAFSIIQTKDSGYIIAGNSTSNNGDVSGNHGGEDYWIVKLDSNGGKQWQKSIGGSGDDFATSIIQTSDGGYAVAGYSASNDGDVGSNHGYNDFWIVRLSDTGPVLWQRNYGGSADDRAYSIIQTSDHCFLVAGRSYSNDSDVSGNQGNGDYWILKLDSTGGLKWQRSLGGSSYDEANCVIESKNGGYVVSGKSFSVDGDITNNNGGSDYWIVKLDTAGNTQGQRSFGGSNDEKAPAIVQAVDGSYVAAGTSSSNDKDVSGNHDGDDYWVIKLSSNIGIVENVEPDELRIIPNPSNGKFGVYGLPFTDGTEFRLYNVLGEGLTPRAFPKERGRKERAIYFDIDVPPGIYFLQLISNEGEIVKKVVISR